MIMDRLYGGVCYAGIDTDPELRYPVILATSVLLYASLALRNEAGLVLSPLISRYDVLVLLLPRTTSRGASRKYSSTTSALSPVII